MRSTGGAAPEGPRTAGWAGTNPVTVIGPYVPAASSASSGRGASAAPHPLRGPP